MIDDQASYVQRLNMRLDHLEQQMRELVQKQSTFDSTSALDFLRKKIIQVQDRLASLDELSRDAHPVNPA